MSVQVRYCKKTLGLFKVEYVFDEDFTIEFLKSSIPKLFCVESFEFEKIELKDDTSIFDGGIRFASSELSEAKELIENNLNDDITTIALYGKYKNAKVCFVVLKDENIVKTSCRKDVDLLGITNIFSFQNHIVSLEELKKKLDQEPLLKNKYFIGRASDNKECLVYEDNKWMTFFYEKGRRCVLKTYTNEEEACAAFYERMMKIKALKTKQELVRNGDFTLNGDYYEKTFNGVVIKISKKNYTPETLAYAYKIADLYSLQKQKIIEYVILKSAEFYSYKYTADELMAKLNKPYIEILKENWGVLVWANHRLDEHIIRCEFGNDIQLSYVTFEG